ncbi:MAG TPA: glycosyl hydrolase-related protein [Chloroflexota bacterium]|jgi:alpha-mannosidase
MPQPQTRPWTVFILPSSHNDVGWAGTPSEIAEHRADAIIDTVLRIMERDPTYAFAMEAGLYLQEYLARRPEHLPLLERYTREGRLEWGATYVQPYEGLLDGESLVRQVYWGRGWMRRDLGLAATGYWNIDVAGRTPQMAQILARAGVEYMVLSRNEPGLYWWEAPDGSRTLVMSLLEGAYVLSRVFSTDAAHFSPMEGGAAAGGGYRLDLEAFARELLPLLERWESFFDQRGLPRLFLVAATADYAVPDERLRALIEQWNAAAEAGTLAISPSVRLRFGNVRQYVGELKGQGDLSGLPVVRGEFPNPWVYIHGPCHHKTVSAMRAAADQLRKAETFLAAPGGQPDRAALAEIAEAWRAHLYPDHGYGGLHGEGTDELFRYKSEAGWHGARRVARRAAADVARTVPLPSGALRNVVVFNPLSWARADWVEVELLLGPDRPVRDVRLADDAGTDVPLQVVEAVRNTDGTLRRVRLGFVARDVPSLGYRTFRLLADEAESPPGLTRLEQMLADDLNWENRHLRVRVTRGGLAELFLVEQGRGLLDAERFLGLEVVELGSPGHDVGEGEHVDHFDWRAVRPFQPTPFGLERTGERSGPLTLLEDGPLRTRVTMQSRFSHGTIRQTFALYRDLDRVDLVVEVRTWDGTHGRELRLLFGPRVPEPRVAYDVPFGHVRVGQDEYHGFAHLRPREVLSWISAEGAEGAGLTATLSTSVVAHDWLDPLGPSQRTMLQAVLLATKRSCHGRGPWYRQTGDHRFAASITGHAHSVVERTRFGQERRHPLEAVVVAPGECAADAAAAPIASWLGVAPSNVVVTSLKPSDDGDGLVVRCCEVEGRATEAVLTLDRPVQAVRCNLLEERQEQAPAGAAPTRHVPLSLGPFEVVTLKLTASTSTPS